MLMYYICFPLYILMGLLKPGNCLLRTLQLERKKKRNLFKIQWWDQQDQAVLLLLLCLPVMGFLAQFSVTKQRFAY